MPYVPHKNGRPAREDAPARTYSIRLTDEERQALDANAKADKRGRSASELARAAMKRAKLFQHPDAQ